MEIETVDKVKDSNSVQVDDSILDILSSFSTNDVAFLREFNSQGPQSENSLMVLSQTPSPTVELFFKSENVEIFNYLQFNIDTKSVRGIQTKNKKLSLGEVNLAFSTLGLPERPLGSELTSDSPSLNEPSWIPLSADHLHQLVKTISNNRMF